MCGLTATQNQPLHSSTAEEESFDTTNDLTGLGPQCYMFANSRTGFESIRPLLQALGVTPCFSVYTFLYVDINSCMIMFDIQKGSFGLLKSMK